MRDHSEIRYPDAASAGGGDTLCMASVPSGFPSPADDYIEGKLDLNEYLIRHPAATFFVRASGDTMTERGIHHGDIVIVDRALEPYDGAVVIAAVDGELMVKQVQKRGGRLLLIPGNTEYCMSGTRDDTDIALWGVATTVIHSL